MGLRGIHRSFHRLVGSEVGIDVLEPAAVSGGDRTGLLEQVHGSGALGRGGVHLVLELCGPERFVVLS